LERVCRLLWVKPSLNYDQAIFQREFANFRQVHQDKFQQHWSEQELPVKPNQPVALGVLPTLPPRRWEQKNDEPVAPELKSPSNRLPEEDGLSAIAPSELGKPPQKDIQFEPWDVPISLERVLQIWKRLRYPLPDTQREELDWEGTIERINREGIFSDVVMRPLVRKGTDLLLLIDEGSGMIPYAPVWQPWIQAVEERRISPAQIYYFSFGVNDALYDWYNPLQIVSLGSVLMRSHHQRSVLVVLSDAGAATRSADQDKVKSMQQLLRQLSRTTREIIWLNPVPASLWNHTAADEIAQWMQSSQAIKGVMLPFEWRSWWETLPLSNIGAAKASSLSQGWG
jgi:uncharacterized protein with von Willebrand factor type A (vWA) domain